jgi:hypothetical protein
MAIDLAALDEKIRNLQLIRKLATDPTYADLLSDIVGGNGAAALRAQTPPPERKGVRYDVLQYVVHPSAKPMTGWTTARQITEQMEGKNYKFKSKDHATTVRESLRDLEKEGLVQKEGTNPEDGAAFWRRTL